MKMFIWMFYGGLSRILGRWKRSREKTLCVRCSHTFHDLSTAGVISISSAKGRFGFCFGCFRKIEEGHQAREELLALVINCARADEERLKELMDTRRGPAEVKELDRILKSMPDVIVL